MDKVCKVCNITKDLSEFSNGKLYKDGKRPCCIVCRREYENAQYHKHKHKNPYDYTKDKNTKLIRAYGITYNDYINMLEKQNGCCAICGTTDTGKRKAFCVDHNHKTGSVRELLCFNCNTGIGNLKDDITVLHKAIEYLEKHNKFDLEI